LEDYKKNPDDVLTWEKVKRKTETKLWDINWSFIKKLIRISWEQLSGTITNKNF
jgi:hypothetical protein